MIFQSRRFLQHPNQCTQATIDQCTREHQDLGYVIEQHSRQETKVTHIARKHPCHFEFDVCALSQYTLIWMPK